MDRTHKKSRGNSAKPSTCTARTRLDSYAVTALRRCRQVVNLLWHPLLREPLKATWDDLSPWIDWLSSLLN